MTNTLVGEASGIEATVRSAATGDEVAFAQLIAEHHASMARVAYVVCGDVEVTRDAVQAAWAIAITVTVVGCGQPSGAQTSSSGSASTPALTTSQPPTTSTGPSAAASQAAAPQAPVEVSGRFVCGPPARHGATQSIDVGDEGMVLSRYRGGAWRQTVTMSDPRLEGAIHHTWEADTYSMPTADGGPEVWAATYRIVNDAGAWEVRGIGGNYSEGDPIGGDAPEIMVGQGAYEGLIAILEVTDEISPCGIEVKGLIFHGAPVPEPFVSP